MGPRLCSAAGGKVVSSSPTLPSLPSASGVVAGIPGLVAAAENCSVQHGDKIQVAQ